MPFTLQISDESRDHLFFQISKINHYTRLTIQIFNNYFNSSENFHQDPMVLSEIFLQFHSCYIKYFQHLNILNTLINNLLASIDLDNSHESLILKSWLKNLRVYSSDMYLASKKLFLYRNLSEDEKIDNYAILKCSPIECLTILDQLTLHLDHEQYASQKDVKITSSTSPTTRSGSALGREVKPGLSLPEPQQSVSPCIPRKSRLPENLTRKRVSSAQEFRTRIRQASLSVQPVTTLRQCAILQQATRADTKKPTITAAERLQTTATNTHCTAVDALPALKDARGKLTAKG